MRKVYLFDMGLLVLAGTVAAVLAEEPVRPETLSKDDIAGAVFSCTDRSGAVRFEITEPYGVDEFMYFLEGSVTLTSSDGHTQVVNAGEAVTIPKEWTGVWDTQGYTKLWVIYSEDGSGLE